MPSLLVFAGVVIVLFWVYIFWFREWAVARWPDRFSRWHQTEDWLWSNSRNILAARLYWVGGILLAIHETLAAQGFDWTPVLQQLNAVIDPKYQPLALAAWLIATGLLWEYLRRLTTGPVGEK